jgi:hypothetical protein
MGYQSTVKRRKERKKRKKKRGKKKIEIVNKALFERRKF